MEYSTEEALALGYGRIQNEPEEFSNEFASEMHSLEEDAEHEEDDDEEDDDEEEDDEEEDDEEEEEEEEGQNDDDEEDTTANDNINTAKIVQATSTLASLSNPSQALKVREVGNDAVWTLSTAKPGNGVTQIRDSSIDTYWQSDGGQPHLINIHFLKRRAVCEIAFYLDYTQDESYTPKKISIRSGMTFHDLEEIKEVELHEPVGWVSVPLHAEKDPLDEDDDEDDEDGDDQEDGNKEDVNMNISSTKKKKKKQRKPLRTFLLQVCVVSMHQNGRDLHCRQVKIFGPRLETDYPIRLNTKTSAMKMELPKFRSVEMSRFSVMR